ncbi:MAG: hypothetical protein RAO75_06020 [Candidatus Chlorobium antarcticum]|jgi:hypothetical protein|nr:hypothetical protein [Candidatus Chlorobium antarcticum]
MKSFINAAKNGETGFVIRNSLFLPFHCELLSIWIGKEMSLLSAPDLITDIANPDILGVREVESFTNLVFRKWGDLAKELGHEKGHIILHAAEKGADVFVSGNLHYIRIAFCNRQKEVCFEIIDNPYEL